MTVAARSPAITYQENGITLQFAAPFRYIEASHLEVARIVSGEATVLPYGSAWNATPGDTDDGGTVTLAASVAGAKLRIRRKTPRDQLARYLNTDRFPSASHELALDRGVLAIQEQEVMVGDLYARGILAKEGEAGATIDLSGAGDILVTGNSGDIEVLPRAGFAGRFFGGNGQGYPVPLSGTGNDPALRVDLASVTPGLGRSLIARPTVAQLLASTASGLVAGSLVYAEDTAYQVVSLDGDLVDAAGTQYVVPTNAPIRLSMLGAVSDAARYDGSGNRLPATDNAAAITRLNELVRRRIVAVGKISGTSSFGYATSQVNVDLSGQWGFSNSLILWPGANYTLPGGALLRALANGQTIARTPNPDEVIAALGAQSAYGTYAPKLEGGGTVDGDDKASIGVFMDTVTDGGFVDVVISKVSYRRFTTTATGTSASDIVAVATTVNMRVGDLVRIAGAPREFFTIRSISGLNVRLSHPLGADLAGATLGHRATGFLGNCFQQSELRLVCQRNDVSWCFGSNRDGVQCTDVKMFGGKTEFSNIGEVIVSGDIHHYGCTIMHSFEREVHICSGIGITYVDPYIETLADSQSDTLVPPGGTVPIGSAAVRNSPAIYITGGRVNLKNINWPSNPTSTGFRRLIRGGDTFVDGILGATVPLLENPAIAGDFGIAEQIPGSTIRIQGVRGWSNLGTAGVGDSLIVKPDGTTPDAANASWSYSVLGNEREIVIGPKRWTTKNNANGIFDLFRIGDTQPRTRIASGSVQFGDGTASPDVAVQRAFGLPALQVNGLYVGTRASVPATSSAAGIPGNYAVGGGFAYFYTGDGTTHSWVRIATSTF
ncbi:hypothetical protein [Novosphingobium sp. BL-52-GroH]|uniref:hypothetical protein n=1 Tax=Novosphingobium sp. BL-52-GroH TaxID=3349877 RepID=UPI00384E942D